MKPQGLLLACVVIFCGLSATSHGAGDPTTTSSAACDPYQLSPCADAILYSSPPTSECCASLYLQRPCLCQYARDPNLAPYVASGGAQQVLGSCGVPVPNC